MYYKHSDTDQSSITIRPARGDDAEALQRLAERDSSAVPEGELLVAIADGELRAAVSLHGRGRVADPFHPTAGLVRLLSARVRQLRGPRQPRRWRTTGLRFAATSSRRRTGVV